MSSFRLLPFGSASVSVMSSGPAPWTSVSLRSANSTETVYRMGSLVVAACPLLLLETIPCDVGIPRSGLGIEVKVLLLLIVFFPQKKNGKMNEWEFRGSRCVSPPCTWADMEACIHELNECSDDRFAPLSRVGGGFMCVYGAGSSSTDHLSNKPPTGSTCAQSHTLRPSPWAAKNNEKAVAYSIETEWACTYFAGTA